MKQSKYIVYSYDYFGQRAWIGEFNTEIKARKQAAKESGDIYNCDDYVVMTLPDMIPVAVYQTGEDQGIIDPYFS